jgi:hypothetical protein
MKSVATLMVFLLVFAAACGRGPRTTRAATDAEISARERNTYEDRIEARLDDLEHRFDGLEARRKGLDKAAQERLEVDIDELRDRKDALEEKVDDLHKVSDQSWPDIKASLDRDLDELEAAYHIVSANNQ